MESITVKELIELLSEFNGDTHVTAMLGFTEEIIRGVNGDDEEGVYLDIGE